MIVSLVWRERSALFAVTIRMSGGAIRCKDIQSVRTFADLSHTGHACSVGYQIVWQAVRAINAKIVTR